MIPFTAMSGLEPSARAVIDPRTVQLALELLERTAGTLATMPALPSVIAENARKRGQAWSLCTPCAQAIEDDARQLEIAPALLRRWPGMPDRHRTAASGCPHMRRRLQKRALAAVAQPAPPGTLILRRTSMAQSAAHKHDSTRRATYQDVLDAPAHQVAEIIRGHAAHPPPPGTATHIGELYARQRTGASVPQGAGRPRRMVDPRRAGAAPRRGHPGPGPRGVAPGADGGVARHGVPHPRAGLGVRGALRLDAQA